MIGFGSSDVKKTVGKRTLVGVGEMHVTTDSETVLSTYALGSCVGVVVYDGEAQTGGLLHVMLPNSSISEEKAKKQPHIFADTGMESLRQAFEEQNVNSDQLKIVIAGGASAATSNDVFKIGQKNIEAVKEKIEEFSWTVVLEETGGLTNRSMHMDLSSGKLIINLGKDKVEVNLS